MDSDEIYKNILDKLDFALRGIENGKFEELFSQIF